MKEGKEEQNTQEGESVEGNNEDYRWFMDILSLRPMEVINL